MLRYFLLCSKMNQPYIHNHPPFWTSFSFRTPQCIKQRSLCYTAGVPNLRDLMPNALSWS